MSLGNRLVKWFVLTAAYLGMSLIVTYPLIQHFDDYFIGGSEDGSLSVWSIWWMKYALVDRGQDLFDCGYLLYPSGANLTFNAMPKLLGAIGIFSQQFLSLTVTYNLIIIFTFVSSGLAAYWLAYRFLGHTLSAFIAGAFFAFSPYRLGQISHLHMLATAFIPIYIALIIKMRDLLNEKRRSAWIYCLLSGVIMALTAYDTEHYAIFLIVFSVIFLLYYLPIHGDRLEMRKWLLLAAAFALVFIIASVLFSPILLAAKGVSQSEDMLAVSNSYASALSADALSFFTPSGGSELVATPFRFITDRFSIYAEETYLDLVVTALAITGIWYYRKARELRLLIFTTIAFAILSLGPTLYIFGKNSRIPMPYMIFNQIPYLNAIRAPSRYVAVVSLTVALLAGYGSRAIFSKFERFRYPAVLTAVTATAILFTFTFETMPKVNLTSSSAPAFMQEMAASETSGTVIDVPLGWETTSTGKLGHPIAVAQLYQITHLKPMVGGIVSRAPKELIYGLPNQPVLHYLSEPSSQASTVDTDTREIGMTMEKYQIAYVVIHKMYPKQIYDGEPVHHNTQINPEELKNIELYVNEYLGMEKVNDTDEVVVYRRKV